MNENIIQMHFSMAIEQFCNVAHELNNKQTEYPTPNQSK